jgi:hypothetical protein
MGVGVSWLESSKAYGVTHALCLTFWPNETHLWEIFEHILHMLKISLHGYSLQMHMSIYGLPGKRAPKRLGFNPHGLLSAAGQVFFP